MTVSDLPRRCALLPFLILVCCAISQAQTTPQDPAATDREGTTLSRERPVDTVLLDSLQKLLVRYPENPQILSNIGAVYYNAGRYAESAGTFERVIRTSPDDGRASLTLAFAYVALERNEEALTLARRARLLRPDDPQGYVVLATSLANLWMTDSSVEVWREAIGRFPQEAALHKGLGKTYFGTGSYGSAIESYLAAAAIDTTDSEVHYMLALACNLSFRHHDAIDEARAALRLAPRFPGAYELLGSSYLAIDSLYPACDAFRRRALLDSGNASAWFDLGVICQRLVHLNTAEDAAGPRTEAYRDGIDAYRRAIMLRPDWAMAHHAMATICSDMDELPMAVASCERAVALDGSVGQARFLLGLLRLRSGDRAGAAVEQEALREIAPDLAEALGEKIALLPQAERK